MSIIYDLDHVTTYHYRKPVKFGQHRAVFLPRVDHNGRIISYALHTNIPSKIRWKMDTLSNTVTLIDFDQSAAELIFTCHIRAEHFGIPAIAEFPLEARARSVPVQYTPDEWDDLVMYMRPHTEDIDGIVNAWAQDLVSGDQDDTLSVLQRMMDVIWNTFTYQARDIDGTQSPTETLRSQTGTCRDYAWLMIEALRRLGFAARFVSGYLYDAALDGGEIGMQGSGATHAWLQVYLPGAGWRDYDPTNRISEGFDLVRVPLARHPGQQ
jgi:transglutaminase-like putative cysteine protease